jgi:hypothetical protein
MAAFNRWTAEANTEALSMFHRAIELDPQFASAYGLAARCHNQRKANCWPRDRARQVAETVWLVQRAADLGKDDAVALASAGIGAVWVLGDPEHGDTLIDRSLALNPNWAWASLFGGWAKVWLGEPEVALARLARAMRLSPCIIHNAEFERWAGSEMGDRAAIDGAKALAMTAIDYFTDMNLRAEVSAAFAAACELHRPLE